MVKKESGEAYGVANRCQPAFTLFTQKNNKIEYVILRQNSVRRKPYL